MTDASPQGDPLRELTVAELPGLVTEDGVGSYLLTGVGEASDLLDVTDPANPIRLVAPTLETDSGRAIYFSYPSGRRLELR